MIVKAYNRYGVYCIYDTDTGKIVARETYRWERVLFGLTFIIGSLPYLLLLWLASRRHKGRTLSW